jgi:two-component system, cell cycle sensor histidine kinase and response regulator CckA
MKITPRVAPASRKAAVAEEYRSLIEKAPLGVYRRKRNGSLTMANLTLCRMLGYESSKNLLTLNLIDDIFAVTMSVGHDSPLAKNSFWQAEVRLRRRDGSQISTRITESPAPIRGTIDGFVENISAQCEAERKLEIAQKMEAIGQLAGGVAHDFNNIINLIGFYAELLAAKALPAEQVRAHAEAILQGTRRGASLTQQLLALGQSRPSLPERIDVDDLLLPIKKTLPQMLGNQVICRILNCQGRAVISIDRSQWEQVILNLALNARDSMPNGGTITIATRLIQGATATVFNDVDRDYLELTVTDTGVGMDESTLLRVFEPYFTTKARGKGTGLGLTLVYKVVSENGGSVNVSSTFGEGTRVRILMPTVEIKGRASDANSRELEQENSPEMYSSPKGRWTACDGGTPYTVRAFRAVERTTKNRDDGLPTGLI